jgi:hypothetical protein
MADRRPTPQVEVEALAYELRAGVGALSEPSTQRRLAELDEAPMREIAARLTKARWNKSGIRRVPPWSAAEIEAFIRTWRTLRDRRCR